MVRIAQHRDRPALTWGKDSGSTAEPWRRHIVVSVGRRVASFVVDVDAELGEADLDSLGVTATKVLYHHPQPGVRLAAVVLPHRRDIAGRSKATTSPLTPSDRVDTAPAAVGNRRLLSQPGVTVGRMEPIRSDRGALA
jgi:hypothetical protein